MRPFRPLRPWIPVLLVLPLQAIGQTATGPRVLGLWNDRKALAIPFRTLEEVESIELRFDGRPIVVFWAFGTRSALDAAQIDASRDIGSTGPFETTLGGQRLSFTANRDGRFVD